MGGGGPARPVGSFAAFFAAFFLAFSFLSSSELYNWLCFTDRRRESLRLTTRPMLRCSSSGSSFSSINCSQYYEILSLTDIHTFVPRDYSHRDDVVVVIILGVVRHFPTLPPIHQLHGRQERLVL